MAVLKIVLSILYLIICIGLVVVVLIQDPQETGLSSSITGSAETFFGSNKGRSKEAMKRRMTAILAASFIILSLILGYLILNVN